MAPGVRYNPAGGGGSDYAYSTASDTTYTPAGSVSVGRRQTTLGRAPTRRIMPGANNIQNAGANINRGRTLIRPDRYQEPPPLLTGKTQKSRSVFDPWVLLSRIVTFWALPPMLRAMKMPDPGMQQAWREKFTLCFIIACMGGIVAFITMGVSSVLCPPDQSNNAQYATYNDTLSGGKFSHRKGTKKKRETEAVREGVALYFFFFWGGCGGCKCFLCNHA